MRFVAQKRTLEWIHSIVVLGNALLYLELGEIQSTQLIAGQKVLLIELVQKESSG